MPELRRAVITGAPGAGKSTLLAALSDRGIAVEQEAARAILRAPGGMALRENDPLGFAQAMLAADLEAYGRARDRGGLTILDRGFPDIQGFLLLGGIAVPPALRAACKAHRYEGPIVRAPAWREVYRTDSERTQNWDQAQASDAAVSAAWCDEGYRSSICRSIRSKQGSDGSVAAYRSLNLRIMSR